MNLIAWPLIVLYMLLFLVFLFFSIAATIYWVQTSKEQKNQVIINDKTKLFLYWYGFFFAIFVVTVIMLSFVGVFSWILFQGIIK